MPLYIVPGAPALLYQQDNKILVLYCTWHQHCIIWVMNMRQNISSGVSKNIFWEFRINVGCTSAVISLWDMTNKKIKTQLSY